MFVSKRHADGGLGRPTATTTVMMMMMMTTTTTGMAMAATSLEMPDFLAQLS
jgi:hypothetical protein